MNAPGTKRPEEKVGGRMLQRIMELLFGLVDFSLYIKENWQPVNSLKERCEKI